MTELEKAAEARVSRMLEQFPDTAIYTKLSREGIASLVESVFLAGARYQAERDAKLCERVRCRQWSPTECAQAIRASVEGEKP